MTRSRAAGIAAFAVSTTAALALAFAATRGGARGGRIRIATEPAGATIFVDGVYRGIAPLVVDGLDAGPHAFRAEKAGFVPLAARIDPDLHAEGETTFALVRDARGPLRVVSDPPGAELFVDGQYRGTTPVSIEEVPAGSHLLRVEKSNHSPWTGTVDVGDGQTATVECKLEDRVLEFLKRAVEENPNDVLRHIELGHYYIVKSEPEMAAEAYKAGRELGQGNEGSKEDRNRLEKQVRKDMTVKGAIGERFRLAMQQPRGAASDSSPQAALDRASKEEAAGRIGAAADIVEQALRHTPTDARLAAEHARLRIVAADASKASAALTEAFRRADPKDVQLRVRLGELCLKHKDAFDAAHRATLLTTCAGQVVRARGGDRAGGAVAARVLAGLQRETGHAADAVATLQDAVGAETQPAERSRLELELGRTLLGMHQDEQARTWFERAAGSPDAGIRDDARQHLDRLSGNDPL